MIKAFKFFKNFYITKTNSNRIKKYFFYITKTNSHRIKKYLGLWFCKFDRWRVIECQIQRVRSCFYF